MGYKVDRFEGTLYTNYLCRICKGVLRDPVSSRCEHIFCYECIRQRVHSKYLSTCPVCLTPLRDKLKTPDSTFIADLLELRVKCGNGCRQFVTLKYLATHERDECINTIVSCPNKIHGCAEKIRRKDISSHLSACLHRPVLCEACGHGTLFCNIFSHQKRRCCVQTPLRQELVRSVRSARRQIRNHMTELKGDVMHGEVQQRKLDHLRSGCVSARILSSRDSSRSLFSDLQSTSGELVLKCDDVKRKRNDVTALCFSRHPLTSPRDGGIRVCKQCSRSYRPEGNDGNACRWHLGPILQQLFGGICGNCGRLIHQHGCMVGAHVPETPESENTTKDVNAI